MAGDMSTLAARAADLRWFHTLHLPDGVVTNGEVDSSRLLPRLDLPGSLVGKTVLDVGAWDGYYSFECAQRGATRVLATDSYSWGGDGWGTQAGFLMARSALGLAGVVEDQHIDVMDLTPAAVGGTFDIALMLGVLYHLRDPVTALERVASCCSELLILETETALNWLPYAAGRIYPSTGLANDHTNWYQFNFHALQELLDHVGFGDVELKFRTPLHRRLGRSVVGARNGQPFMMMLRSSRIVIHARRTRGAAS